MRTGRSAAVPNGKTVSECPSNITLRVPLPLRTARMSSPAVCFFKTLHLEAELGKLFLKPILYLVDTGLVVAPGVDACQIPEIVDVLPDLRFEPANDRFAHGVESFARYQPAN